MQVECGHEHTIALSSEGKVYGFGRNTQFQLANTKSTSQQPHLIQALEGHKITQIACGSGFTMAITETGELIGFGQNSSGQVRDVFGWLPIVELLKTVFDYFSLPGKS